MRVSLIRLGIFAALAAGMAVILHRQHETGLRLKRAAANLRNQEWIVAQLRGENEQLRAEGASSGDLDRLGRDYSRIAVLRQRIRTFQGKPGLKPSAAKVLVASANDLKFAGSAAPGAAFESAFWAVARQEVDTLANLLEFDKAGRAEADALFGGLPAETQVQYGSPEKVIATMLAANVPSNLSSMEVLSDSTKQDDATLLMRVERTDGTKKDTLIQFHREQEGWRLVVPASLVTSYAQQLSGPGG